MNSFFRELFAYNHHANQELIKVFQQYEILHGERSGKIFSHMLNAHHIWNCRIGQLVAGYSVWEEHPVQRFGAMELENFTGTMQLLENADLGRVVQYHTSKGDPFINTVQDILFHIINHSTYHRGQLASLFRQQDISPVNTDYIFYKR